MSDIQNAALPSGYQAKIMDQVQTTVITPDNLVASTMDVNVKVQSFKDILNGYRKRIYDINDLRKSCYEEIKNLIDARSSTVELMKSQAASIYPELYHRTDFFEILKNTAENTPLRNIWEKFKPDLARIENEIQIKYDKYDALVEQAKIMLAEQNKTLAVYDQFSRSTSVPTPSSKQLVVELELEENIPSVEESSVEVERSVYDLVDTEAQGLITRELAVQTMVAENKSAADASFLNVVAPKVKPVWLLAGAAAFLYVMFGRK